MVVHVGLPLPAAEVRKGGHGSRRVLHGLLGQELYRPLLSLELLAPPPAIELAPGEAGLRIDAIIPFTIAFCALFPPLRRFIQKSVPVFLALFIL